MTSGNGNEEVTSLFKAFRTQKIDYAELVGSLTKLLSVDAHFATQIIAAMDTAQQQTPIPVTDFIQLRNKIESTAETFQQQEMTPGPAEAEATKIYAEEHSPEVSLGSSDPTIMASIGVDPTAQAQPVAEATPPPPAAPDYDEDATVIMQMPPKHTQSPQAEPSPVPASHDDNATLIAAPTPEVQSQSDNDDDNATLIAHEPSQPPKSSAPKEALFAPTPPTSPTSPGLPLPLIAGAGGLLVLLVVVLVILVWPSDDMPDSSQTTESPWGAAPADPVDTSKPDEETSTPISTQTTQQSDVDDQAPPVLTLPDEPTTTSEPDPMEAENTSEPMAQNEEPSTESSSEPQAPIVKDEAYYWQLIQQAVTDGSLAPADQNATATYYLVQLINLNQDSDFINDARTIIAQKHLKLATEARKKNQWDLAQEHLDNAFKVRLPDSYMP